MTSNLMNVLQFYQLNDGSQTSQTPGGLTFVLWLNTAGEW